MRLIERRAAADAAFAQAQAQRRTWLKKTRAWRSWIANHRAGVIVGGGFFTGVATSLLPIAPLMRLASAFAGTASLMLQGPFLRLLSASHDEAVAAARARAANP